MSAYLLIIGGASLAMTIVNFVMAGWSTSSWVVGMVVSGLTDIAAGLICFFGSWKVANFAYPNNRIYCRNCGWDLTADVSHECSQCGVPRAGNEATDGL